MFGELGVLANKKFFGDNGGSSILIERYLFNL